MEDVDDYKDDDDDYAYVTCHEPVQPNMEQKQRP